MSHAVPRPGPRSAPSRSRAWWACAAFLAASACASARGGPREAAGPGGAPHTWKSTCTVTCSDGTARTITARVARERMPADPPCDVSEATVEDEICPGTGAPAPACGGCTAWVESP